MKTQPKQILFASLEPISNSKLRGELTHIDPSWVSSFAGSAAETLETLAQPGTSFEVVVIDGALPNDAATRLLNTIQQRHPDTRRVLIADLSDTRAAVNYSGLAHHCLPKPWSAATIRRTLDRILALNVWLSNPTVRELVNRMKFVPSPPELYFQIVQALQSNDIDTDEIAESISRDPAITAKLLQLSNSALLGLKRKVLTVREALSYLGLDTTRSLILLAHTFSNCEQTRLAGFDPEQLWRHSLATGMLARRIAMAEETPLEIVEESFLAGLLHDMGKLLFASNMGFEYGGVLARARDSRIEVWEAELDHYGATHADVAAELLATWNLPLQVVEAVALHHYPSKMISPGFSALAAVHAANAFEHENTGTSPARQNPILDMNYLADIQVDHRLPVWRESAQALNQNELAHVA